MNVYFRRAAYLPSQFRRFSNLEIANRLARENTFLDFNYFTQLKELGFSLKRIKNKLEMVENSIEIIQCLTFLSDIAFLLFFAFN